MAFAVVAGFVFGLAQPTQVFAATITSAGCSQSAVQSAIGSANVGDTVQVPSGNCSWSGLSLSKAIHLKGAGVKVTNITLTGNNTISKQAAGVTRISGFSFSKSGGGNGSKGFTIGGSWEGAEPVVIQGNEFTINGSGLFRINVAGGVIIADNDFKGGWDDSFIQPVDSSDSGGSWRKSDTLGARDTTGKRNHYFEDNTFYGGTNQGIDCDLSSRCVYRYNTLTYSSFNSHGKSTGPYSVRHFEVYNNEFRHPGGTSQIAAQSWAIWIRGGTGVIFNNRFDNIAGSYWGNKPEMRLSIRGAEDARPQGSCGNVRYPVPEQLGQNHNGSSYFTDPIYIWGNTGATAIDAGWTWGNPCGFNWATFFQWGRDAVNNGTPKPGYAPYTYPHPLRAGGITSPPTTGDVTPPPAPDEPAPSPTVDTTSPSRPTNLAASAASSSRINVSWSASTDNVGVTGYQLQRCSGANCTDFSRIASPSGASYADAGLTAGTTYRYRVRAVDAAGNRSSYSGIASATTQNQSSTSQTSSTLPSGSNGIAKQYNNDTGLSSDPNVIFSDDFESYTSGSDLSTRYDSFYQQQNFDIASGSVNVFSGEKSLQLTHPNNNSAEYNNIAKKIAAQDVIFVRYYTKLENGFSFVDGNAVHNGVSIKGGNYPGPGRTPNGRDFFYVGLENTEFRGEPQPGYTHAYVYHPDQRSGYGDHWYPDGVVIPGSGTPGNFGDGFVPMPLHTAGRNIWYSVELMVRANTPGVRDGRVAAWIDGKLIADWQNVRFRDTESLKINLVELGLGSPSNTDGADRVWIDNLVIAKSYIGPMLRTGDSTPSPTADTSSPSRPTNLAVSAASSSRINVSWSASTDDVAVTGYQLQRCSGANCTNFSQIASPSGTSYADTGLAAATIYRYRVRAVDAAGNRSSYSSIVSATTQAVAADAGGQADDPAVTDGQPTEPGTSDPNNDSDWAVVSTLFRDDVTPATKTSDPTDYELGVRFQTSRDGLVTALRYYRGSADANDTDTRTLNLWSAGADKLGSVTIRSNPGESGWQSAKLPEPVTLQAGKTYVASYGTVQNYAYSEGYFGTAHDGPDGVLTAAAGNNGVFANGRPGAFPTQSYLSSNYWVDVAFEPTASTGSAASNEPAPSNSASVTPSLSLAVAPATIAENGGVATGTVTRSGTTSGRLVVALTSEDTGEATVPANVTIESGESTASFAVQAVDDTSVDGTQQVTLRATAPGATAATTTIAVSDNDVASNDVADNNGWSWLRQRLRYR